MAAPRKQRRTIPLSQRLAPLLEQLRAWVRSGALQPAEGRLPRLFLWFLLLFGVGMIVISLVGDQGLIAYYRLQQEARSLRQEVAHLEARRGEVRREIRALRHDEGAIETLARRELGLVKPGETVVQLLPPGEAERYRRQPEPAEPTEAPQ